MKKILIDLYKIKDLYSGLGQFSLHFANTLESSSHPDDYRFCFLVPKNSKNYFTSNFALQKANFQKRYFSYLNEPYDIWHSLHQFPSHLPAAITKHVLTIHDLNFLLEKKDSKALKYLKKLQKNVNRADVVTAISAYTKKMIEENIDLKGKSVQVIYNGVKLNTASGVTKPKFMGDSKFFFSLSVFKSLKNLHVLLPLISCFEGYQLVLAGNNDTSYGNEIKNAIKKLQLDEKVLLPGIVTEDEKVWLYRNCEAFILPSLAEGFSLPVVEAMLFGKAVFLSKSTCLPETGGDAAFYFDNFETKHMEVLIREKLKMYHADFPASAEKTKLHASQYNWNNTIGQYMHLYSKLL